MSIKNLRGGIFFLLPFFLWGQGDDVLKIEGAILPKILSKGEAGVVMIRVTVPEGITVGTLPEFTIEFKPSPELGLPKNFFNASDLQLEIIEGEGGETVNLKNPIKIPFTVNPDAVRGSHILEGKIRYTARSKKEGWLIKTSSKFFTSFYIRQTGIVKKK